MGDGWHESANAWLAEMGDAGDHSRQFVLDPPMLSRIEGRGFATALDVGCGEGRFCRMLQTHGLQTVGIDPTARLIERARARSRRRLPDRNGRNARRHTAERYRRVPWFNIMEWRNP